MAVAREVVEVVAFLVVLEAEAAHLVLLDAEAVIAK